MHGLDVTWLAGLFAAATAASYGLGFAVAGWLRREQVLDVPNARSMHSVPTPRGGGIGIMLVIGAGAALVLTKSGDGFGWTALGLTVGLAAVSFVDDRSSLSWRTRIGAQVTAALVAAMTVTWWSGGTEAWWLMAALAFVFCGYANAFNFMDGINGIAGMQAALAGLGTVLVALVAGLPANHPAVLITVLVIGAAAGFLPHNFPRARLFMGDVGSVPLGFLLAVLAAWVARDGGWWLLFPLALLHANFALDPAVTLVRRWRRGESLHEAHRDHFYQRVTRGGWSHARATITEGVLQIGVIIVALGVTRIGSVMAIVTSVLLVAAGWAVFFGACERTFKNAQARENGPRAEAGGRS